MSSEYTYYTTEPTGLSPQEKPKKNPVRDDDDYCMLMQFFQNARMSYIKMAAQKQNNGDAEGFKYFAGKADGIGDCILNIEAFRRNEF